MAGKQGFSALESDPGTVNSISEDEDFVDAGAEMAMDFISQRDNPELHGSEVAGTPSEVVDGDEIEGLAGDGTGEVQPQGTPQGEADPLGVGTQPGSPAPVGTPAQASPQQQAENVPPVGTQPSAQGQPAPAATPTGEVASQPGAQPAFNPAESFRLLHQTIEQQQPQIEKLVADQAYQLSADELEKIQTEPEKVLPSLMARVHMNAVKGVLRHVAQQLPATVGAMIEARDSNRRLEDQFYQAWPQLDRVADDGTVRTMAAMYRRMNPQATFEDMVRVVGAQAVVALGKQSAPARTPTGARAPAPTRRAVPFVPAAPASAAPPQPKAQTGEWERFAQIMMADDAGSFESR